MQRGQSRTRKEIASGAWCGSSVRVQETLKWEGRLSLAPTQRWGQDDPDSFPMLRTWGLTAQGPVCGSGAFFLQLALAHVPHICMVSLVLVLFHFLAALCWALPVFPDPSGPICYWKRPRAGCFQLETRHILWPPVGPWSMHSSTGSASWSQDSCLGQELISSPSSTL